MKGDKIKYAFELFKFFFCKMCMILVYIFLVGNEGKIRLRMYYV